MKFAWMAVGLLGGMLISCSDENASSGEAPKTMMNSGYSSLKGGEFSESDFSPWMSKADQQVVYDNREDGTYFAFVEGRNNGGFHQ